MAAPKILLVEDHPTSRKLLAAMLKKSYTVLPAASGAEAVEIAKREKPDLVLLDIEMPGLDGFQTLEKLRSEAIEGAVPIIFITALGDSDTREKGLEAGAVDYLTKPFDRPELSIKVKNHLALYQARKEIERTNLVMAQEMEMASQLQRFLLPQSFPRHERLEFSVLYKPSFQASGDFYDLIEMGGMIGFTQVDVSGHGLRSAMIGAMFKMAFQSHAKESLSPATLVSAINDEMVRVTPDSDFLTLFCGMLNPETCELVYTNAGHPRPFLYRAGTGEVVELGAGGIIVGAFPEMAYEEGRESLRPGDCVLLYTDGVTEAGDLQGENGMYGEQRLRDIFLQNVARDPDDLLRTILEDVETFQGDGALSDDISLLLVSVR